MAQCNKLKQSFPMQLTAKAKQAFPVQPTANNRLITNIPETSRQLVTR